MKMPSYALAVILLSGTVPAWAQTASPSVGPTPGATPGSGVVNRNTGTAAAAGDRNQVVATTSANASEPARGSNSFSQGEARRRIESRGYQNVTGLHKDAGGVWRGTGMRDGVSTPVWLDYKGNVGPLPSATPAAAGTSNPPGTAAGRAMDRTLGTNTTGTNPAANRPDGAPGNPPGTAAGRAVDRTLGTNTSGANPTPTTRP